MYIHTYTMMLVPMIDTTFIMHIDRYVAIKKNPSLKYTLNVEMNIMYLAPKYMNL